MHANGRLGTHGELNPAFSIIESAMPARRDIRVEAPYRSTKMTQTAFVGV